jgi:hypothetical protein
VERVAVIGSGGAGKSWLARRLAAQTGLPLIPLDAEYWRGPLRTPRVAEEWAARHAELVAKPRWILDGNYSGTMVDRLARADTVVFIDVPTVVCLWGVLRRPDQGFPRLNPGFLRWILGYRRKRRPTVVAKLERFGGEAVILRSRREANRWLAASNRVPIATAGQTERKIDSGSWPPELGRDALLHDDSGTRVSKR